jgi:hypothetical protein
MNQFTAIFSIGDADNRKRSRFKPRCNLRLGPPNFTWLETFASGYRYTQYANH